MRSRALTAVIAVAALVTGVVLGQQDAGGSRASAQEPPAVFYGLVAASPGSETAPTRIRAYIGDTVCGTADIAGASSGLGIAFYTLEVASQAQKPGCGSEGATVQFRLFTGELVEGDPEGGASAAEATWSSGAHRLDLGSLEGGAGSFEGALPDGPGAAQLRWAGDSGVPVADALATLGRQVEAVFHWDVATQGWDYYFAGAPLSASTYVVVDAGDIVFVRVQ